MARFVAVGEVLKARGVRGALLVRPTTWSMERFLSIRSMWLNRCDWQPFEVESSEPQGELVLVKLKGIDTREDAIKLGGSVLAVPRSEVPPHPEGTHFVFELIGMRVVRTDGVEVGEVADVLETGSNLVYVVTDQKGKETLIPATREVVETLDYEESKIVVRPLPGLFDE
ncbi:MAG: ribosome maturation factor RimM [Candidatus Eisenbacteria bacterium]